MTTMSTLAELENHAAFHARHIGPNDAELDAKFMSCAQRTLPEQSSARALRLLRRVDRLDDIRELTATLVADKVTA